MKICTVTGARPQFIKAAAVSAIAARDSRVEEVIIHTGQHYDDDMSDIFFRELNIPKAKYNLEIGSGPHGEQTGRMLTEIENVLIAEKPGVLLVYGDTNSTVAAAIAAVKIHIPVAHVEAGMRSFNRNMPEEINRVITDHISEMNFCSTTAAVNNLENEGRGYTARLTGDVMYDCALRFSGLAEKALDVEKKYGLASGNYLLMTCHRAGNTDCPENLGNIISAANEISGQMPVLYPVHPRTKNFIEQYGLKLSKNIRVIPPLGYLQMLAAEKNAAVILTDSGGVQKEAFFHHVPCVTMRRETEWIETVEAGWNILAGANPEKIKNAVRMFIDSPPLQAGISPYGEGNASDLILKSILEETGNV